MSGVEQDQGIELRELLACVVRQWPAFLSALVLGAGGGLAIAEFRTPRFEASAIVAIAQVRSVGVEAAAQTVERVQTPGFMLRAAKRSGDASWLESLSQSQSGRSRDLSIQIIKATNTVPGAPPLLELKLRAPSPRQAGERMEATLQELTAVHAELAKPALDKAARLLEHTQSKLAVIAEERDLLRKTMSNAGVRDERFTQLALVTSTLNKKDEDEFLLRREILELEASLRAPETQPTRFIESYFVSANPVSPRTGLIVLVGVLAGLIVGVLIAVWRERRTMQSQGA